MHTEHYITLHPCTYVLMHAIIIPHMFFFGGTPPLNREVGEMKRGPVIAGIIIIVIVIKNGCLAFVLTITVLIPTHGDQEMLLLWERGRGKEETGDVEMMLTEGWISISSANNTLL